MNFLNQKYQNKFTYVSSKTRLNWNINCTFWVCRSMSKMWRILLDYENDKDNDFGELVVKTMYIW